MGWLKPSSSTTTTTEGQSPTVGAKQDAKVKKNERDGITFWSESTSENKAPEVKK
jgi:hypothetical protein